MAKLVIPCPECSDNFEHTFTAEALPPVETIQQIIDEILDIHFEKAHAQIKEPTSSPVF